MDDKKLSIEVSSASGNFQVLGEIKKVFFLKVDKKKDVDLWRAMLEAAYEFKSGAHFHVSPAGYILDCDPTHGYSAEELTRPGFSELLDLCRKLDQQGIYDIEVYVVDADAGSQNAREEALQEN